MSSMQNQFRGTIARSCRPVALTRVTVDASGTPIVAAVTARSVRELELSIGKEIVAASRRRPCISASSEPSSRATRAFDRTFPSMTTNSRLLGALASRPPRRRAARRAAVTLPSTNASVKAALDIIKADNAWTLQQQVELTQIPAPPFKESARAAEFKKRLEALGLQNVRIDEVGNVIAERTGTGKGPRCSSKDTSTRCFPKAPTSRSSTKATRSSRPASATTVADSPRCSRSRARSRKRAADERHRVLHRQRRRRRPGQPARHAPPPHQGAERQDRLLHHRRRRRTWHRQPRRRQQPIQSHVQGTGRA